MKLALIRVVCCALAVSLTSLSFQTSAGMISTEETAAAAHSEKAQIQTFLTRAEVVNELQSLGVDLKMARERVSAMTDDEARNLAGALTNIPAGADGGWIVVIIVLALFSWWWWYRNLR